MSTTPVDHSIAWDRAIHSPCPENTIGEHKFETNVEMDEVQQVTCAHCGISKLVNTPIEENPTSL